MFALLIRAVFVDGVSCLTLARNWWSSP